MPTINQLIRQGRKDKVSKSNAPIMDANPQKRGVCLFITPLLLGIIYYLHNYFDCLKITKAKQSSCFKHPITKFI